MATETRDFIVEFPVQISPVGTLLVRTASMRKETARKVRDAMPGSRVVRIDTIREETTLDAV